MAAKPKPVKEPKKKSRFMKRGKKTHRQILEIACDAMVKRIVLARDGFCVCPAPAKGHGSKRSPGHLISRGKESVKWSLINVHEQCDGCNLLHEFYPERYTNWFLGKFGLSEYEKLVADSLEVCKLSVEDLENLLRQLEEIHEWQKNDKFFKPRFTQKQILSGSWKTIEAARVNGFYFATGTVSNLLGAGQ